jgi:hypothetical protein
MTPAPKRRWFRFSLRTLFVAVTVFAIWLGLELKFIRERRDFLETRDRNVEADGLSDVFIYEFGTKPKSWPIPFWRRWLGDETRELIVLWSNSTDADRQRAAELFPEAQICRRAKQVLRFKAEQKL